MVAELVERVQTTLFIECEIEWIQGFTKRSM